MLSSFLPPSDAMTGAERAAIVGKAKSCRDGKKSDRLRMSPSLGNLYMRSGATNGLMVLARSCSALLASRSPIARARSASRAAHRSDRLRSFAGQTGRNPAFIVTLGTAIPLPKGIASPVTEFGSSRLTELLIRLEDKVGLIGSGCGLPREGRGRNQRDQRESSDERFHDASP